MTSIEVFATPDAPGELLTSIRTLLAAAFDGDFSDADWEHALGGWHAIARDGDRLLAHAAVVARTMTIGERRVRSGYVEAVATHPDAQGVGHGSEVMQAVMDVVRRDFEIGLLSTGRHAFYERLGWEPWQGPTYVVRDGRRIRTADEDDGLMALRLGSPPTIALTEAIACDARRGDDW